MNLVETEFFFCGGQNDLREASFAWEEGRILRSFQGRRRRKVFCFKRREGGGCISFPVTNQGACNKDLAPSLL